MTKLDKSGILPEDKQLAINVLNYLRSGNRVIGDPGEGLRQTLANLEARRNTDELGPTDWGMDDAWLEQQINLTKAGLRGEEDLCDFLSSLIKYDDKLDGLVAFASLSYNFNDNSQSNLDYTPDTDTLLVYGNHVLIVDAKNIKTKPDQNIAIIGESLVDADNMKEIIQVHPSTHIWQKVFDMKGIPYGSIEGYVCIVNKTQVNIIRDEYWYDCHTKPIHICELRGLLEKWVEGKDSTLSLKMLTEIAKAQIKKEKDISFDVDKIKRQFGI